MNKSGLPANMQDLSGAALKEAMMVHRKNEIVKLVCRQTDYTEDNARALLEEEKYNYISIIKAWLKPTSKKVAVEKKSPKSLHQKIIGEIRNFMDQGHKLQEHRKKQMAQMRKRKAQNEEQKKALSASKKMAIIPEEENKKL